MWRFKTSSKSAETESLNIDKCNTTDMAQRWAFADGALKNELTGMCVDANGAEKGDP